MSVESGIFAYWERQSEVHHAGTMMLGKTLCGESTIYMQIEADGDVFALVTCSACTEKIKKAMRRVVAEMEAIGGE